MSLGGMPRRLRRLIALCGRALQLSAPPGVAAEESQNPMGGSSAMVLRPGVTDGTARGSQRPKGCRLPRMAVFRMGRMAVMACIEGVYNEVVPKRRSEI